MEKFTSFNLLRVPTIFWPKVKQIAAIKQKTIRQMILDLLESEVKKYKDVIG